MIDKIKVYVRNEEAPVGTGFVRGPPDHPCLDVNIVKTERVIPETDRLALEVVNEFAREKGLQVEVCDVSTLKGKLKASLRGINKTPVVLIGKGRIEGEHDLELLRTKLESYFTE